MEADSFAAALASTAAPAPAPVTAAPPAPAGRRGGERPPKHPGGKQKGRKTLGLGRNAKKSMSSTSRATPLMPCTLPSNVPSDETTGEAADGEARSDLSFLDMMTEDDAGIDDVPLPTNSTSLQVTADERNMSCRTSNYSIDEDVALVLAWESVTNDPITGNDQPGGTYWNRISEHFHRNVKTPSSRSVTSLSHRWGSIRSCCSRWGGCMDEVSRIPPSGVPLQDYGTVAQRYYKQKTKGKGFNMHHCWTLLEHNEKWIARDNDKPQSKRRKSSNSPDPSYTSDDGDEDEEEAERGRSPTPSSTAATNDRPPGRKQSKEKAKRDEGGGYKEALREMMTTKKEIEAGKKEEKDARWMEFKAIEERKVAIQEAMMMHKKKKEQHRVMFMDITHFDETQTAFVHAERSQILAELLSSTMEGTSDMGGNFNMGANSGDGSM